MFIRPPVIFRSSSLRIFLHQASREARWRRCTDARTRREDGSTSGERVRGGGGDRGAAQWSALAVNLSLRLGRRETPRIVVGGLQERGEKRNGGHSRVQRVHVLGGVGENDPGEGGQESSSDTRTTATLRGHGQSARETSSANGGGHASIAPASEGAPSPATAQLAGWRGSLRRDSSDS